MNTQETKLKMMRAGLISLLSVALLSASEPACAVTTTANGWIVGQTIGDVTVAAAGPSVTVRFSATTEFLATGEAVVIPTSSDLTRQFTGNYLATHTTSMSFNITSGGVTPGPGTRVVLKNGDREWYRYVSNVSPQSGVPAFNRISFNRADGWNTEAVGDPDVMWAEDLCHVDFVGITVMRNGIEPSAHSFTITAFALDGDTAMNSLSPLQQALALAFNGLTSVDDVVNAGLAGQDNNQDGMTDLDGIRAVYDPDYFARNLFKVRVVDGNEGFTVKWACVEGKSYRVLRASALAGGSQGLFVEVQSWRQATETGFMTWEDVDANTERQYFYKVVQQ